MFLFLLFWVHYRFFNQYLWFQKMKLVGILLVFSCITTNHWVHGNSRTKRASLHELLKRNRNIASIDESGPITHTSKSDLRKALHSQNENAKQPVTVRTIHMQFSYDWYPFDRMSRERRRDKFFCDKEQINSKLVNIRKR